MQEEKKKLVNQARKGDTHAFAKLYEEIYPDLYRFAFCMVKQPWKAEDVVSDAVLKAFEKIHTLKKPESFRSWIFQITANECRLQYRKEKSSRLFAGSSGNRNAGVKQCNDGK